MMRFWILSVLFGSFFCSSDVFNSTSFQLILSDDRRAFRGRQFHIFYEKTFRTLAETMKAEISGTVKAVHLEELPTAGSSVERICTRKENAAKFEKRKLDYMATITRQKQFFVSPACTVQNQLNLMKTPRNEWAVQIRGHITDLVLPMEALGGEVTSESLHFALNALFFATAYGFGDSEFKSLGDGAFKKNLFLTTLVVYLIVVFVAAAILVFLVVLFFVRRRQNVKKREKEKSKLLRNQANNNCDETPVIFDDAPDTLNKS